MFERREAKPLDVIPEVQEQFSRIAALLTEFQQHIRKVRPEDGDRKDAPVEVTIRAENAPIELPTKKMREDSGISTTSSVYGSPRTRDAELPVIQFDNLDKATKALVRLIAYENDLRHVHPGKPPEKMLYLGKHRYPGVYIEIEKLGHDVIGTLSQIEEGARALLDVARTDPEAALRQIKERVEDQLKSSWKWNAFKGTGRSI